MMGERREAASTVTDGPDTQLDAALRLAFEDPRSVHVSAPRASAFDPASYPEIDGFQIVSELGVGGMGIVYEAEQRSPRRRVALKVSRAGSRHDVDRRTVLEGHLLARLDHPNVAEIHQAGACDLPGLGRVEYFAMALVEGARPITTYAREERLAPRDRVRLVMDALDGVGHGHARGVVHRDLKPSNLLVDRRGTLKVIDFGLARSMATDPGDVPSTTLSGAVLGTPQYMSPEQWLDPRDVDARSDVYSLGVVLFELLTEALPFDFSGMSVLEIGRAIANESRSPEGRAQLRSFGELAIIVEKAMEHDARHRYASAAAMREDLRRYLSDEPIAAHPPSRLYRLIKYTRRNRALVLGSAVVLATALTGMFVSLAFARSASSHRARVERQLLTAQMRQAFAALAQGHTARVERFLAGVPEAERSWEWRFLATRVRDASRLTLHDPGLATHERTDLSRPVMALDPRGARAITAARDGKLRIWDLGDGALERVLDVGEEGLACVDWSPDGDLVATGGRGGVVHVHDASSGSLVARVELEVSEGTSSDVKQVRFGPSRGQIMALSSWPGFTLRVHDLATGEELRATRWQSGMSGFFDRRPSHPDEVLLGAWIHRGVTGPEISIGAGLQDDEVAISGAWGPRGRHVVLGCRDGAVESWDARTAERRWHVRAHGDHVIAVAYSVDGALVASTGNDGLIKVWDAGSGALRTTLTGHDAAVLCLRFLENGELVSASSDGTLRLWEVPTRRPDRDLALPDSVIRVSSAEFDPAGGELVVAGMPGSVTVLDVATGDVRPTHGDYRFTRHAVVRPGGSGEIALGADTHTVSVQDAEGERLVLRAAGYIARVAYDSDGDRLFASTFKGEVRAWSADSGDELWTRSFLPADGSVRSIALEALDVAPDDRTLVVGARGGELALVDTSDGSVVSRIVMGTDVRAVRFRPDGERLLVACSVGGVRELRVSDLSEVARFDALSGAPTSLVLTSDGERLFVGYSTGVLRGWSRDGEELFELAAFQGPLQGLALSPDGNTLAAVGNEPRVRLWTLDPVADVAPATE